MELAVMERGLDEGNPPAERFLAQPPARVGRRSSRSRLLIVDDENGPRQALRMLLKEDHDVELASGVLPALAILREKPIDIIITDIRMPQQTGLDLLRISKQQNPDVQVIILTGYGELGTAMEAIEHGAFAYLEKPFDNDIMLDKVRACIEKQRQEDDRRALEYLAIEANRFETVGRLVSGTMHDLGTPLSVIGTHLEVVLADPQKPDLPRRLETMKSQVQHCMDLVHTTMGFLRHSAYERESFDFNEMVRLCVEVVRPLLTSGHITVAMDLGEDVRRFSGYLVLVRQAVINLIHNACQALDARSEERLILLQTWMHEGVLHFAVEDNGPGVDAESRDRIFETLYTTKGEKGTGLGLTVVRNVMDRHGGAVHLEAGSSRGARFVLSFPVQNFS